MPMHPYRRLFVAGLFALLCSASARAAGDGLAATIYDGATFSGPPRQSRIDKTIDFQWPPPAASQSDLFSIRWTGQLQPIETGRYTIQIQSAGAVRLWIDGRSIIYNWKHHGPSTDAGTIDLAAGRKYDIRLQYFHATGPAILKLSWQRPGQRTFDLIPQTQLHSTPTLDYSASWLANSFNGARGALAGRGFSQHMPADVDGAFVCPDGSVYLVASSGDNRIAMCKDGQIVGLGADDTAPLLGTAIAADETYVYVSEPVQRRRGEYSGAGIRRYSRLTGKPQPFEGGEGAGRDSWDLSTAKGAPQPTGLTINLLAGELYVADPALGFIRVYDTFRTGPRPLRGWEFDRPDRLAIEKNGVVWVSQRRLDDSHPGRIVSFSPDGKELFAITDVLDPTALAVDDNGRLLVADSGQNIRIYNIHNQPTLVGQFGESIFSDKARGAATEKRFAGITGLGTDAHGNLFVAQNGVHPQEDSAENNWSHAGLGAILESYNYATGRRNWALFGLTADGTCDLDGEANLYTLAHRLTLDLKQPPGRQWTYAASTCNPQKYSHDSRLTDIARRGTLYIRRVQGKLLMFTADAIGAKLCIHRFTDGEVAVPSGVLALNRLNEDHAMLGPKAWPPNRPSGFEWIWRDANGDGRMDAAEYSAAKDADTLIPLDQPVTAWWPDTNGDVWAITGNGRIRRFRMNGFDPVGNPIYDFDKTDEAPLPRPLVRAERIEYIPATDTMWLSGYTAELPDTGSSYAKLGTVICRYDNWSKEKKLALTVAIPHINDIVPSSMSVAGDYLFVQYLRKMECRIYDARTGAYVGLLEPKSPLADDQQDVPSQGQDGLRVVKCASGEYLVLVPDRPRNKTILYRWRPAARDENSGGS